MSSFGRFLRNRREELGLPLRKVAAELDIDTSILSKIERNERSATKEMLPIFSSSLNLSEKDVQVEFIKSTIHDEFGELEYLKDGLESILQNL